ncbi:hypothetical protein KBX06_25025 [Micromonospora sp. C31]|uniref:hypothetical protein n=1 Tax=Micromonospora sp. C31 TaxID=2824876 RepID=UPI001B37B34A|nr:hypothetical protein [Micromonospora sp. C31]MBQ1076394.1 hypothetical protein [Micromonospora sp. C31]
MARDGELRYTLAQYARRVGISDSRARALLGAGRLAHPDGHDPDGRPYWHARTIDSWCRRTQRQVPDDADWPIGWEPAPAPVPIIERRDLVVEGHDPQTVSVIVYDTPHGHVVHVMRHNDYGLSPEVAARVAAEVLHPVFWADAVVLVPEAVLFGMDEEHQSIEAFRLRVPHPEAAPVSWLPRFLTGLAQTAEEQPVQADPRHVQTTYIGYVDASEIQQVLGRPVPLWYYRTCTPDAVRLMQAYGESGTVTVPDTTTDWPATRDRVAAGVDAGLHLRYPHAFGLLAADAMQTLRYEQTRHSTSRDRGDGWYIVARPARPDWPSIDVEHVVATASAAPRDPDAMATELPTLREEEAGLPWDSPVADALWHTARLAGVALHRSHPEVVFTAPTRCTVSGVGPVLDQWRKTLQPLSDAERDRLLRAPTRRLARLLVLETHIDTIREHGMIERAVAEVAGLYRDPAGRLVIEDSEPTPGEASYSAEWPTNLPDGWGEQTVIASDGGRPAAVFALTPQPDGRMQVDPLPNPGSEPGYTWGYSGSGPRALYRALVRCALRDWTADLDQGTWLVSLTNAWRQPERSPLWAFILKHQGPLRMPWPQVIDWAQQDLKTLTSRTATGQTSAQP